MDELRDLARRSRRTAAWGGAALAGTMLVLFPAAALVARIAPAWADWVALAALAGAGLLFLRFAFVAGQERGAFRAVFRRIRVEREAMTRVPVQGPPATVAPESDPVEQAPQASV